MGLLRKRIVDQQSFEGIHSESAMGLLDFLKHLFQHLAALFNREKRLLLRIHEDRDDYLIEEFAAALDDVEMAIGNWIE
jgi:hypothetical protein